MKFCPSCGARYEDAAKFCQHDGTLLRQTGAASEEDPYVGQVLLGQFEIKEVIGEGGMGRVYRAHQNGFDRDVAIKILHTDLVTNQEMVKRFNREAKIISRLDHPSIIHVYLFGELPDGNLYLAMEYVDGHGLSSLINDGPTPVPQTIHIGRQILGALTEAHRKGVVHRDLKPDNIMLVNRPDDPDTVKVLDFGIAKFLGSRTMLTQQGLVFGSARYISPEAAAGEAVDERADIYAVGVILFQMFAGKPPFDDSSAVTLLMRHVNDPPPQLIDQPGAKHVPEPVAQVVMQSLEKDPDHRFSGAFAMRTALTEAARASGIAIPQDEGGVASWSAPPLSALHVEEGRGEAFQTDPMFGGAISDTPEAPAAQPEKKKESGSESATSTVPGRPVELEGKNENRPSSQPTAPQKMSISGSSKALAEQEPIGEPKPADATAPERESDDPHPYGDPNDDEIELPKTRAWAVLIFILVLALAGGAVGALIALQTGDEPQPTPDAGTPPPTSPVAAGLNQTTPTPDAALPAIPDTGPEKLQPVPTPNPGSPGVKVSSSRPSSTENVTVTPLPTKTPAPPDAGRPPTKTPDESGGMPPAAAISLEPRRPQAEKSAKLIARISPATKLESPRFVISARGGESSWRDAKMGPGGTYVVNHTFQKAGSYQVTFVAKSPHGEVRAFSDAVVSAKRRVRSKNPTPSIQAPPPLSSSENKPPGHENGPPLLEPWNTPAPW